MAALGIERSVHGEATNQGDGVAFLVGGEDRRHGFDCIPGQATGGRRVNGTMCHGPLSIRQWAKI